MVEEIGNGTVWTGWRAARDTLRDWREANIRKSDVVVELGRNLLENYSSKLGSEGGRLLESLAMPRDRDMNLSLQRGPSTSKYVSLR